MRTLKEALRHLREDLRNNGGAPAFDAQTTTVFVTSTVLLTLFYYYGRSNFYRRSIAGWLEPKLGERVAEVQELLPYAYWGLSSLTMRVLIPLIIIVAVFRQRPSDWGFRLRGIGRHLPIYGALYVAMLPFLYWASTQASFANKYPFYRPALEGGAAFWKYEAFYALQFVGVEAFFRGFIIFGLFKKFGYYALYIMAIPYVMIHFNKPIPETLGALVAGVVLGYLAIKSKSFVPGILLHLGIAWTMDILAVAQNADGLGAGIALLF